MNVPPTSPSVQTSRRAEILRQGLNLATVSGFGGVTIGLLSARLGMSKSGLFAHFKSKEELQRSLLGESERTFGKVVIQPALAAPEGLPRLRVLTELWFGWPARAGLQGGCPVAAGMFELDDQPGPLRGHLLTLERDWRALLGEWTASAVRLGHLRPDLDREQFVWELCGIYLNHHVATRFIQDPQAAVRAQRATDSLLERSL